MVGASHAPASKLELDTACDMDVLLFDTPPHHCQLAAITGANWV